MKEDIGVILEILEIVQDFPLLDKIRFLVAVYHMDNGLKRMFQMLVASLFALVIILVILIPSMPKETVFWIGGATGALVIVLAVLVASIPRKRQ